MATLPSKTITPTSLSATFNLPDNCDAVIAVSGTYTSLSTLSFLGSLDGGVTFPFQLSAFRDDTSAQDVQNPSPADSSSRSWKVPCIGYNAIKISAVSLATGSVTVQCGTVTGSFLSTMLAALTGIVNSTPVQGSVQRVNAGYVAPGQTAKTFTGKIALSNSVTTTTTLETVTTGKTLVITDLYISADGSQQMDCRLQAAGTDIFRAVVKGDTAPIQMPGIETQPVATSAQLVTLVWPVTTNVNGYFFISGIEQ